MSQFTLPAGVWIGGDGNLRYSDGSPILPIGFEHKNVVQQPLPSLYCVPYTATKQDLPQPGTSVISSWDGVPVQVHAHKSTMRLPDGSLVHFTPPPPYGSPSYLPPPYGSPIYLPPQHGSMGYSPYDNISRSFCSLPGRVPYVGGIF